MNILPYVRSYLKKYVYVNVALKKQNEKVPCKSEISSNENVIISL